VSRRGLLGAGLGAATATLLPAPRAAARRVPARRMVDLTHTFSPEMPTFNPEKPDRETIDGFEEPPEGEFGFYSQRWTFTEHVGTHMDAPGHVIGGRRRAPDITPEELLVPAVVIDIRAKAEDDPNATVDVEDLAAFERGDGRIPDGAAVLMDSGWGARWDDEGAYRGGPSFPDFNFPGFSPEACEFLIERRGITGVGVDTLSTDPGESTTFPAHEVLGRGDRWGLENLAGLDRLPSRGATLVVGLVPWEEGSGGPCRTFAFW
jgi:kynurenine formamidase